MKIKPFASMSFCSRCGAPVPRWGLALVTKVSNFSIATPFVCSNCKRNKKARKLNEK